MKTIFIIIGIILTTFLHCSLILASKVDNEKKK